MDSNFTFLESEFPALAEAAKLAEKAVFPDPHAACFHCRRALELTVHWLYRMEPSLHLPYEQALGALLHEPSFQKLLPEKIFAKTRLIQRWGNDAVHGKGKVYQLTALNALEELQHILYWVARTYSRNGKLPDVAFNQKLVPFPKADPAPADQEKLKKQEAECRITRASATSITSSGATMENLSPWSRPSAPPPTQRKAASRPSSTPIASKPSPATGTGKTRTAIALADVLQRHNWMKSVLFLADRVSLVNQANAAFKKHFPESNPVNLVTEKDKTSRVYTCTYPTMMGLIDTQKDGEARFSPSIH